MEQFRDMVLSGGFFQRTHVDRHTGEIVDPEARAIFSSLPAITPATTPDEILAHGLVNKLPHELHRAIAQPKYRMGRDLFVRTKVSLAPRGRRGVGHYDEAGEPGFTHRAVLRAKRGDDFLVDVEGAPALLAFPRAEVFAWNEPYGVPTSGGKISGVQVDYNAPLLKAHICAGYLDMASDLEKLDFSEEASGAAELQERLIYELASRINMTYAGRGDGYSGHRAGSLLHGGQGVCFVQRAVAGAYLQAFARVLAFDLQIAVGRTLAHDVPHGFLIITLRPSLKRFVCDPAWFEPLTDVRVAFFDKGWGHDRRLYGFEGQQDITVRPHEIDLPEEESL
jgi:hypothetical protein